MGPSMSIDGVNPTPEPGTFDKIGFNGAVDEHRRSPRGGGRATPGCRSFNGAVDEHRRSHASAARRPPPPWLASMGPSMSIDGVRRARQRARPVAPRFNGAVDEHRRSLAAYVDEPEIDSLLQWGRR